MITAAQARESKFSMIDNMVNKTEDLIRKAIYLGDSYTRVEVEFATVTFDPIPEWKERMQEAGYIVRQYESTITGVFKFEVRW